MSMILIFKITCISKCHHILWVMGIVEANLYIILTLLMADIHEMELK